MNLIIAAFSLGYGPSRESIIASTLARRCLRFTSFERTQGDEPDVDLSALWPLNGEL